MTPLVAQLTQDDVCLVLGRLVLAHELELRRLESALRAQIEHLKAQLEQRAGA